MTPTTTARVVTILDGVFVTKEHHIADLPNHLGEPTGVVTSPAVRAELYGQPKFAGFCGPMWDGDALRYESREAYAELSR